ncbi:hypothetical protein Gotur_020439 [Gossypium turneri]
MKISSSIFPIISIFILLSILSVTPSDSDDFDDFFQCLPKQSNSFIPITDAILTPNSSSFQYIYQLRASNLRPLLSATSRPVAIITALHPSHAQAAVICAKRHDFQLRIRSGGHDYEGLSYTSDVPFVILDMFNLNSIDIDMSTETAWVQAGATTGELYYRIAEKSNVHGFPSGVCTTLGIGGHFSGGGYGFLMRKYGLSIDNVIDAQLIDANGRILNRKSMGEDVFWAIRGGGTTSFGIILSWSWFVFHLGSLFSPCKGPWNKAQRSWLIVGNKLPLSYPKISSLDSSLNLSTMVETIKPLGFHLSAIFWDKLMDFYD